ncbi:YhcN/YlaJ family sporulation lipoprotein [Pseudalkalibacillus sp. R45]|uniref:YhcN/YlaJ family sporulation lipoprotein n=1 Tax=Pseudalkalibacillus sp. R45 TaxID=3457433 RepID=UPI003FCE8DD5
MIQFQLRMKKLWTVMALITLLAGCNFEHKTEKQNTITTQELATEEGTSLEKNIKQMKGVEDVEIMQAQDDLLVAIKITTVDRFQLKEITKKVKKKVEKKYPEMDVTVSPDKKIFMEMDKFETKHAEKQYSEAKIHKKIKSLVKLSKDEG